MEKHTARPSDPPDSSKPTVRGKNPSGKTIPGKSTGRPRWRVIPLYLAGYDILAVSMAYFLALWFRFDGRYSMIPENYLGAWMAFAPVYCVACLAVFYCLRLYQSLWQFASYNELVRISLACGITSALHIAGITLLYQRMPLSYYFVGSVLQLVLVLAARFSYRIFLLVVNKRPVPGEGAPASRVMLVGAGAAGQMILRDINSNINGRSGQRVCCIIDDDPNKWNRFLDGVPVVGGREDILANVKKYAIKKIYLALPSATAEDRRDILDICKETGCELRNLPGMYQLVQGEVTVGAMKEVSVEDLLGREPVRVNLDEIFQYLRGKVILVTGGGGSIGSELCRQIASHGPRQLIIFDVYENNAYEIQQELVDKYPDLNLLVLIGSVRDSRKINQVFGTYRPDVVYHAAAHKHVPLMEASPCEAIKNNAIGTYKTAYAAMRNGCKRFVLISTDKAVNPVNIMGASKRLCEMVIQSFDRMIQEGREGELPLLQSHSGDVFAEMDRNSAVEEQAQTRFVAVRFGNVLGSNGSVIPLFKKQIEKGGPVTVTHPDIIRYFMTIPEAVSLVLQAGTYAKGGEIFVLDMGAPVKIDTLARNLIKLSGHQPDVDIMVSYTGLRPGEKLYEEKLMGEEGMKTTPNRLIQIGSPIPFDTEEFLRQMSELMHASYENRGDIHELVARIVPTYRPAGENGSEARGKAYEEQVREMAAVQAGPDSLEGKAPDGQEKGTPGGRPDGYGEDSQGEQIYGNEQVLIRPEVRGNQAV